MFVKNLHIGFSHADFLGLEEFLQTNEPKLNVAEQNYAKIALRDRWSFLQADIHSAAFLLDPRYCGSVNGLTMKFEDEKLIEEFICTGKS